MSDSLSYEIPPSTPRRSAGVYVAWIVIAAVVVLATVQSTRTQRRPATSGGIQLEMTCRYVVGAKSIFGSTKNFDATLPGLSAQARLTAVGTEDHLRIIPVIAELEGTAAAREAMRKFLLENPDEELKKDAEILSAIYAEPAKEISSADAARLTARHGWFGELAVSAGPNQAAVRQTVMAAAKRTLGALLGGLALILLSGAVGLVLLIIGLVRLAMGKLPARYPALRAEPVAADIYVQAFAVYLAGMVLISLPHLILPKLSGLAWDALLFIPIAAAICFVNVRGISWGQMARDIGWTRGAGIAREMATGVVGYISGLPLIGVGVILATILGKISHQQLSHPIVHYIQDAGPNRILLFILACVFAPLAEETMFRGVLFSHMRLRHGWIFSALVVSVIFAAIHPQGWPAIPVLASIAMVLAGLREQRGSLIASMTAHALNNFGALVMLILAVG